MPPAPPPDEARLPRILIVDDNQQNAELVEDQLSGGNYELRTAYDGEQALKLVRSWQPDLVLLDIMMPRISGFEVCKQIRADPATADTLVLMLTALDQPSDIDRAIDAGTDEFVSKPIHKAELMLRVRSLLRTRQYKRELDRALAYIEAVERGGD
jgi:DNA-binding response OmpR family regulator